MLILAGVSAKDVLKTGLKNLNAACEHILGTFEVRYDMILYCENNFLPGDPKILKTMIKVRPKTM